MYEAEGNLHQQYTVSIFQLKKICIGNRGGSSTLCWWTLWLINKVLQYNRTTSWATKSFAMNVGLCFILLLFSVPKGIYVPDRDASWELEENAYNELHTPKYSCEAVVCLSKHRQGREYNSVNGFAFMNCTSCGAGSIHQTCCPTPDYICEICTNLFDGSTNNNITIPANALETTENNNTLSDSVLNENRSFMSVRRPTRRSLPVRSTNSSRIQFTPDKRSPFKLRSSEYNGDDSTPKRRRLH